MVAVATYLRRAVSPLVLAALLISGAAMAEVVARVDRDRIEQNESFTLEITIDSTLDLTPDLGVLEQDFHIGQTSRLTNASIVNGQVSRSMTWSITLMPKRAGELAIPPITIGSETSNPLTITVTEPRLAPPGEADVFITSEVDYDETFVQAQVLYTIRIYRAVATRQHVLREPTFGGAEALVEVAGDERSYEAVLNGRAYSVVERTFAVFPQESGEVTISPARFEARVLRDGRISGRKVFESEPQTIAVQPIPAPPADYPDAVWLPAKEVVLSDSWSREPDRLKAGEPISRNISVSALGQLETQIPVIEPPRVDGVNVYPDRPALERRLENDGIRGIRTDQYAMIGVAAGSVTLPPLELPWWDIEAGEWRVARVPERKLAILPGAEAPPPQAAVAPPPVSDEPAADVPPAVPTPAFRLWRRIAEVLAVAWVLTLVAWYWTARPRRERQPREAKEVPLQRQQSRCLKAARRAARDNDARGVRVALLEWAKLEWPDDAPRSIGELAARVSSPLAEELRHLSAASYGATGTWDGEKTANALRSLNVLDDARASDGDDPLPPLMPGVR